ncbi:MAG: hypothetical protein MUD07_05865 [Burkholderiaceae bacterium]|nr:hypothetical protein [Burkholderiaceae bacterium]
MAAAIPPNVHEWDATSPPIAADAFGGVRAQVLLMCGGATRRALRDTADALRKRFPGWLAVRRHPGMRAHGPADGAGADQLAHRELSRLAGAPRTLTSRERRRWMLQAVLQPQ